MFDVSEEDIAKLLIRDAQQLADRAKGMHACAFVYAVVLADWPGQASRVCARQRSVLRLMHISLRKESDPTSNSCRQLSEMWSLVWMCWAMLVQRLVV